MLKDQQKIHLEKAGEIYAIRRHLANFVPAAQHQQVANSLLNERNFVYLDFKNTQKTKQLFKYIVTRLKSVNKIVKVNKIINNRI